MTPSPMNRKEPTVLLTIAVTLMVGSLAATVLVFRYGCEDYPYDDDL